MKSKRLSTEASVFVPGETRHCPVNSSEYLKCVLKTLNTPGGIPSHTFHVKFRADHGFEWKPIWANVTSLNDLKESDGVGNYVESGQLVYGSEDVVLRHIYSSQKPPAPLLLRSSKGLTIIPFLQYDFEQYDVRNKTKEAFSKLILEGLNLRYEKLENKSLISPSKTETKTQNDEETGEGADSVSTASKVYVSKAPWVISDVHPWNEYKVSVQYISKRFGTSLYSETSTTVPVNLNVVFEYESWEKEIEWANHFKEFFHRLDLNEIEKNVHDFLPRKEFDEFKDQLKKHSRIKETGFRPTHLKLCRIAKKQQKISKHDPIISSINKQSPENNKEVAEVAACHFKLVDQNGNVKLVITEGLTNEIKHISGRFRLKKRKTVVEKQK